MADCAEVFERFAYSYPDKPIPISLEYGIYLIFGNFVPLLTKKKK